MGNFIDEVRISVKAGDGGDGAVAFRREKFVPKGGPAGGDGGNGGNVILVVDEGMSTLLDFRYKHNYRAEDGIGGGVKDMYGRAGKDLILRVPGGTQVRDEATGSLLADMREHGQQFVLAKGGRGGWGNIHFATSTNRAPRRAASGLPGEERHATLELKLLADVGLVGFPNAGKSSFISRVSAARPKIADYPFTTLTPNLGMVGLSGERSFVLADVPGLIEGAHEGAGLGHQFLRHLERTRVLLFMIDVSPDPERYPIEDYETLSRELELYDSKLAARPRVIALNKMDLPDTQAVKGDFEVHFKKLDLPFFAISAVTGEGVQPLLEALWHQLKNAPPLPEEPVVALSALPRPSLEDLEGPENEPHETFDEGFSENEPADDSAVPLPDGADPKA